MLRNRSRAVTKQPIMADQQTSSFSSPTARPVLSFLPSQRFFNGLFSPTSPTSILETNKHFSNFGGNPFGIIKTRIKPTKISEEIKNPSENFDPEGIALALIEEQPGDIICQPNTINRKVLFGSKLQIQIPSSPSLNGSPESPGDYGIKTRNSQFSGGPTPTGFGSPRAFTGPLSLSEMELSEEYTRVISHGPNPKTTHIYDNCVVECCCGVVGSPVLKKPGPKPPLESFLSFCHTCKKNLEEDNDIFIYRGEKAFCSEECRRQEMVLDGF